MTGTKFASQKLAILACVTAALAAGPTWAAPLAYDGFDYTLGDSIVGQNGGSGFDAEWATSGTISATIANGLSFSGLATSGNALRMTSSGNLGFTSSYRSFAGGATGTVWKSFLANRTSDGTGNYDFFVGPSNQTNNAAGEALVDYVRYWNTGDTPYVGYGWNDRGAHSADIVDGTTYLFISKFTGVGTADQAAKAWIFTESGYADVLANGVTEANLDTYAFSTATRTSGLDAADLTTDDYLAIGGNTQIAYDITVDEVRLGTSLEDVTVPEPATLALLGLGGLCLLPRRRS